jgi:hypothetical protein
MLLRWSTSRSVLRTAACERDESRVQRRYDSHSENCLEGDGCYLRLLERMVNRHIQVRAIPRDEITLISLPVK